MLFTDTIECDRVDLQINVVVYPEGGVCMDVSYMRQISIITRENSNTIPTWLFGQCSKGTHFSQNHPQIWEKLMREYREAEGV